VTLTLAFVGYADDPDRAHAYEDAVLPLLADHGGRVEFRGRRTAGQDAALPVEVHVLSFPDHRALDAYLADPRRAALLAEHGDVFTRTEVVELER